MYEVYVAVVTTTTLLLKYDTRVHDWTSGEHLWEIKFFSQASYSDYYSKKCLLPKLLYNVTAESLSQTSFSHISTNSLTILTVSTATESP